MKYLRFAGLLILALQVSALAQPGGAGPGKGRGRPGPGIQGPPVNVPAMRGQQHRGRTPGPQVPMGLEHGFRNFGLFVAAGHASRNLNIPFEELHFRMTGPEPMSLGKAIRELRPEMTRAEVRAAEREARRAAKEEIRAVRRAERTGP